MGLDELEQLLGNAGVHQVIGERLGHRQNQQNATHHHHRLAGDARQPPQRNLAVQEHLGEQHVERGHRRRFADHQEAGEDTAQHHERQRQLPAGFPERVDQLAGAERLARHRRLTVGPQAVEIQQHHHQQRRADPRQIQIDDLHRRHRQLLRQLLGDNAVDQQRHRGHQQQAQAARRGHQAEAEAARVAGLHQRRQQQRAQRHDGDAGAAGERGEEGAGDQRHERHAAGHPAERRLTQAHQPVGGARLTEQEAGEGEQRQRHQHHRIRQLVDVDVQHRQRRALGVKAQRGGAQQHREQGRAQQRQQQQHQYGDPDHATGSRMLGRRPRSPRPNSTR